MHPNLSGKLVIWRFTDGKPGHEKQTLGLCNALSAQSTTDIHELAVRRNGMNLLNWLAGRYPPGKDLPPPDLLIGAGHATHLPMLAARRAYGGRIVVLMRPSLPLSWFDLCLIPEHDDAPRRKNVIPTKGAITPLKPCSNHDPGRGLVLVGGPSQHFKWQSHAVTQQIMTLVTERPDLDWTLTTSRRTPPDFLSGLNSPHLHVLPADATPPGWLETQLGLAGEVWVTPDSVSMVYEALTAGCRVGLFDLPAMDGSRVAKGVTNLILEGYVVQFSPNTMSILQATKTPPLDEAQRCARLIL